MSETIDCRGLACPAPVLRVKTSLEAVSEGVVTVLVDNLASRENVRRFAESQGCAVSVEETEDKAWTLQLTKGYAREAGTEPNPAALETAILVTADHLGADPELGGVLMKAFLSTLGQASAKPKKMLFLNTGVLLTTEGSQVLDVVAELEATGVEILSCGTCLEFLGKKDQLRVGKISNMYDTVETLTGPYKIVSLR